MSGTDLRALLEAGEVGALAEALAACDDATLAATPAEVVQAGLIAQLDLGNLGAAQALDARARAAGLALPYPTRLIEALEAAKLPAAAQELARAAGVPEGGAPWQYVHHAFTLVRLGLPEEARAVIEAGLARTPNAGPLIGARARIGYLTDADPALAGPWCRAAAQALPDTAAFFRQLGRLIETGEVEIMGFTLALPPEVVAKEVALALLGNVYETAERGAVVADLRADDRVLELGTGIGVIAMTLTRARPGLPVVTVEANPALLPVIARNFARNGCNAHLEAGLAALEPGEARFNLSRNFAASSTRDPGGETEALTLRKIDVNALIAEHRPTILVCDIEGAEIEILQGIALDGLRRLVVEFHPTLCSAREISATIAHLLAAGFAYDLAQSRGQVLVFDRPEPAAT